jgi:hypothetical protein
MRRLVVLAVALVAVLGVVAPAMAQAPAPKVTITGLIDQIGTYSRNMSIYDSNYNRSKDELTYGRTRGRFDVIGEIGKAKAVLGLEIDMYYGQTGSSDNNIQGDAQSGGNGASGGFDLNTDSRTVIEVKWLYTEFALPIPLDTTVRLGAQPFGTLATNKLAVYANGDFPGVATMWRFGPAAQLNLTYVQVEENLGGNRPTDITGGPFTRGEDWAVIASFDFTPFKGLTIKPMYSFFEAKGLTSGNARQGRGGVSTTAAFASATNPDRLTEHRHTIGVDATWTAGPFSLAPTVLYQFGKRENIITNAAYGPVGSIVKADMDAWLIDVRGGFNVGPLALSAMALWTSGDKASSNPFKTIGYFQPLDTDTSYGADWGTQIFSLGIDYFQILYNSIPGLNPGVAIGYDKYGRIQVGAKAAYSITPAFTVGAAVTADWTDRKVDTDATLAAGTGLTPLAGRGAKGDSRYLGTEVNVSATYRFAPGIAFDVAGGYLFAGEALAHTVDAGGGIGAKKGVDDVVTGTARVRYTF